MMKLLLPMITLWTHQHMVEISSMMRIERLPLPSRRQTMKEEQTLAILQRGAHPQQFVTLPQLLHWQQAAADLRRNPLAGCVSLLFMEQTISALAEQTLAILQRGAHPQQFVTLPQPLHWQQAAADLRRNPRAGCVSLLFMEQMISALAAMKPERVTLPYVVVVQLDFTRQVCGLLHMQLRAVKLHQSD
ncbi:unnamed protein product [Strongylus vulgaris]|uniref:Uncharacterized protein n=1 Tax=Strongylus vulgaris TaxID=40348 RepID=A0A3P7J734_STRVU|nr:unnamed protein product [Strongylus vulgaris]